MSYTFTIDNKIYTIEPGEIIKIGKALYGVCEHCKGVVRINKRFFGDLHFCAD